VGDAQASDFVLLLQAVREALDTYETAMSTPYRFELTVAGPTGPSYYQQMHLADMDGFVDFWNIMAYDYAGSWSAVAGNQANLFSSASNPASTPFNTETVISYYISKGILASKIVLGMPLYGRSFEATDGLGEPYNGVGPGTWEAGVYDLKALPLIGATYDKTTGSSYSYNTTTRELISYDNVDVAKQKAAWIQQMGLGGVMWWESSADRAGNESLIQTVAEILGGSDGSGLECSQNQLAYPDSTYENLRAGMPASGSASATTLISTVTMSEECLSISLSTTSVDTTISYNSTVESYPTNSTFLTVITVNASTTICPITETSTKSPQPSYIWANSTSLLFSEISPTDTVTKVAPDQSQSSTTSALVVPGDNGIPGCAYVLAADLGSDAMCSSDYCYCGGMAAPLLTSTLSGTVTTNCDYKTQPATNSCPLLVTVSDVVFVSCSSSKNALVTCIPFKTSQIATASI